MAITIAQERDMKAQHATALANRIVDIMLPYARQGKITLRALGLARKAKYPAHAIKHTRKGRPNLPQNKLRGSIMHTSIDTA